jgi:hypothetical protein
MNGKEEDWPSVFRMEFIGSPGLAISQFGLVWE